MKSKISNRIFILLILFLSLTIINCENKRDYNEEDSTIENREDEITDGIYDASVTTPSGTYDVQRTIVIYVIVQINQIL